MINVILLSLYIIIATILPVEGIEKSTRNKKILNKEKLKEKLNIVEVKVQTVKHDSAKSETLADKIAIYDIKIDNDNIKNGIIEKDKVERDEIEKGKTEKDRTEIYKIKKDRIEIGKIRKNRTKIDKTRKGEVKKGEIEHEIQRNESSEGKDENIDIEENASVLGKKKEGKKVDDIISKYRKNSEDSSKAQKSDEGDHEYQKSNEDEPQYQKSDAYGLKDQKSGEDNSKYEKNREDNPEYRKKNENNLEYQKNNENNLKYQKDSEEAPKYQKNNEDNKDIWAVGDSFEPKKRELYENKHLIKQNYLNKDKYGYQNQHIEPFLEEKKCLKLLIISIRNEDLSGINALIKRGTNLNRTISGYTPLMYAILMNKQKIVPYLIFTGGADVNFQNEIGQTALHIAILSNNKNSAGMLLEMGASHQVEDVYGYSAYDYAKANSMEHIFTKAEIKK